MGRVEFNGEYYRDDRMYVFYICKCTQKLQDNTVVTTIYHEDSPPNSKWCLVTYKNNERYMAYRADAFDSNQDLEKYLKQVEPTVPLISLGGHPRNPPLSYDEFVKWKTKEGYDEYDYKKMFPAGVKNPCENVFEIDKNCLT